MSAETVDTPSSPTFSCANLPCSLQTKSSSLVIAVLGRKKRTRCFAWPSKKVCFVHFMLDEQCSLHHTEDPESNPPTRWHAISQHIPNRTNKDCRKRWWAQMATIVSKGSWTSDEDEVAPQRFGVILNC